MGSCARASGRLACWMGRSVSRRGRRRSQGDSATGFASNSQQRGAAITTPIFRVTRSQRSSTSSHLQAHRPQALPSRHQRTSDPPVGQQAHGSSTPRRAANPTSPGAAGRGATSCREMALPVGLWPPASPVTATTRCCITTPIALPVANDHQPLHLQAHRPQAHCPRATHSGPPTSHGGSPPCSSAPTRAANL